MQKYRLNLYLPLLATIIIVSFLFLSVTYFLQEKALHKDKGIVIDNLNRVLDERVQKDAKVLENYILLLQKDKNLQEKFTTNNKSELYENVKDIYENLNKSIDLTHFYFIRPNGEVLLRVHDVNKFGDIIDRQTFKKAKDTQRMFSGLEFGLKKNYTLRVVSPWIVNGELVGYIELGKEIDKIISSLSSLLNVETYIAINKDLYKDAPSYVLENLKNSYSTNEHYIVYSTFDIPANIENISLDTKFKNRHFHKYTTELRDVTHHKLGHFIFLADTTQEYSIIFSTIKTLFMIILISMCLLLIIAYRFIKLKEKDINNLTRQLDAQNEFLQKLIDIAPVPIYYKDKHKRFIHFNKAFLDTFGYTKDEIFGKTNDEIEPTEMTAFYNQKDDELFRNYEHVQVYESRWENKDHTKEKYLISYRTVFFDHNKNVGGIIGIIHNVTEQKILESELKEFNERLKEQVDKEVNARLQAEADKKRQEQILIQQSKMASMGEMIGAIAHQWRQPLNALSITKDLLIDDYYENELSDSKVALFEDKTNKLIQYMSKTIDDFRNFFLPSKEKQKFNLYKEVVSIQDIVSSQLKNNNIDLIISSHEDEIELFSYPNEFKQVLINIINNAKDAINKKLQQKEITKGIINIDMHKENKKVLIIISDNGGGIKDDIVDKIFEPYFTTKFEAQGTGLGLYMAKTIIEKNMNGLLTCKNGTYGAVFTIEMFLDR